MAEKFSQNEQQCLPPACLKLPPEIMVMIFGLLQFEEKMNARRVCRWWKGIIDDEILKDEYFLRISTTRENEIHVIVGWYSEACYLDYLTIIKSFEAVLTDQENDFNMCLNLLGTRVKRLEIQSTTCVGTCKRSMSLIALHCDNIDAIEICGTDCFSIRVFNDLRGHEELDSFPAVPKKTIVAESPAILKFRRLEFANIEMEPYDIPEEQVIQVIQANTSSIEDLTVYCLTQDILKAIANCEKLEMLRIRQFSEESSLLHNSSIVLSTLKVLIIEWSGESLRDRGVEEDEIIQLLQCCPNLQELSLYDGNNFMDFSPKVNQAVSSMEKLTSLRLHMGILLSSDLVADNRDFFMPWKKFKIIGFVYNRVESINLLTELIQHSQSLEKLDISEQVIEVGRLNDFLEKILRCSKPLKLRVSSLNYEEAFRMCANSQVDILHGNYYHHEFFKGRRYLGL